VLKLLDFIVPK